jgi:hypothetical protein
MARKSKTASKTKRKAPARSKTRTTKGKKQKDPNAPKRPLSAYFLFSAAERAKIKEAHPDFGVTEIAKELGKRWKTISAADKKPFETKAAKLKAEYIKKKDAYDKKA